MVETSSAFLQYGALGLLAIVLIGVGTGVWKAGQKMLDRLAERDKFMEKLANDALAAKDTQIKAWSSAVLDIETGLAKLNLENKRKLESLDSIMKCLAAQQLTDAERHGQVMTAIEKHLPG